MRSAKRFMLQFLATAGLGFLACSLQGFAASAGHPLDVSFSLEKETVTLHEPVLVRLRADNRSGGPVRLDLGFNRVGNIRFFISGPGEKPVEVAPRLRPGLARYGLVTIAPGETYTQDILLSALYSFSAKGAYLIRANFASPGAAALGVRAFAYESQKMLLRVQPRNPAQLRRVCANLLEKVMSTSAGSAMESAKALSYVNDLVAVPYLERAATDGPFKLVVRPIATDGLARISRTWGKKRVFSLLKQKDPKIKSEISARMTTLSKRADGSSQ